LAMRIFTVPWLTVPPVGVAELSSLVSDTQHAQHKLAI